MALIDELTQLRDKTLASLGASHDYYAHSTYVWRMVQQQIAREDSEFTIRNQVTGSMIDQSELSGRVQGYVTVHLASATFQHFVSLFEDFVFGVIRAWLTAYPQSLETKQLPFSTVLDARDTAEIIAAVVQKEIHSLAFKKLSDWFAYLHSKVDLGCPTEDEILRLAEIKASRDVLVHNSGVVNPLYLDKSGARARFEEGDVLELPERYHHESWELIRQVVSEVAAAGIQKAQNGSYAPERR